MSKGHIISITYNTCLYGLFRVLSLLSSFGFVSNILRYLTPTPRFFVFGFWVCLRILGLFRTFHTHTPRCSTPTRLFFRVLGLLSSFSEIRKQTQNSKKNSGVDVEHRSVCVDCSKQTQNSQTNLRLGNKKSLGGRWPSCCVRGMFETNPNSTSNPKLGNKKSWGGRWTSWCVRGMLETNPKPANKHKTRKQKIVGWALSIVVCAWNVRNKLKTRKQKIVGWALSIVECAWNVRNKPKTRQQTQDSETNRTNKYVKQGYVKRSTE